MDESLVWAKTIHLLSPDHPLTLCRTACTYFVKLLQDPKHRTHLWNSRDKWRGPGVGIDMDFWKRHRLCNPQNPLVFLFQAAYEKIRAGASLVEVYTGLVYKGPGNSSFHSFYRAKGSSTHDFQWIKQILVKGLISWELSIRGKLCLACCMFPSRARFMPGLLQDVQTGAKCLKLQWKIRNSNQILWLS